SGADLKVMRDEIVPAAGKAQIRVIHAAPGAGDIDVQFVGAEGKVFTGVGYSTEAGFRDIDPVQGTIEVKTADNHRTLATLKDMKLEAGKSYTIVVTGSPMRQLETVTLHDSL